MRVVSIIFTLFNIANCVCNGPSGPPKDYPTRTIANVTVVDTPLVRAAESFALAHNEFWTFKHVMRSWLFGTLIISKNSTLQSTIDMEVHAMATILHDLGWERHMNSTIVSPDRRFEVDAAIAARNFIRGHGDGEKWEERRVQLVWDAIALHAERRIAYFKEADVQIVSRGISLDFDGPGLGVTKEEYDAVVKEFPKEDFKSGVNETLIWLCQTKPASTYDNWMQPWGDRYVANYSANKALRIDNIFSHL